MMAGDWLKVEACTPDKPEVWGIADTLGLDPDAVVGKLFRVWAWFDSQTEDGAVPSSSRGLLDRKVGTPGFVDAMVASGWMADDGTTLLVTNFERHNGKSSKKRASTAKRVAEHKKRKKGDGAEGDEKGNAAVTLDAHNENAKITIPRPIRKIVMDRDKRTCVYCGRKENHYAPPETAIDARITIDHVVPESRGGTSDINNLVACCFSCNSFKSSRTPEESGLDWPKDEGGNRYGSVTQSVTQSVTTALPREEKRREEYTTPKRTPAKSKKSVPYSENFGRFWLAYPQARRKEKPKAWAAWKKEKCESLTDQIIAKLQIQYAQDRDFLDGYDPYPERYLKNRKFEDEINTRPPNGKQGPIPAAEARRRAEEAARQQANTTGGRTFDESGQEVFS